MGHSMVSKWVQVSVLFMHVALSVATLSATISYSKCENAAGVANNVLLLDSMLVQQFEPGTKRVARMYTFKAGASADVPFGTGAVSLKSTETFNDIDVNAMAAAKAEDLAVVLFVRRSYLQDDNDIHYFFLGSSMYWSRSKNVRPSGFKDPYYEYPVHIGSIQLDVKGQKKDVYKFSDCFSPYGWISGHGIYVATQSHGLRNVYYDPHVEETGRLVSYKFRTAEYP